MTIAAASIGSLAALPVVPGAAVVGSLPSQFLSASYGTFTANGASSVTVADAGVTASSIILFGLVTVGGTVGAVPSVKTQTAGTGFTVACTASDTSVYGYLRLG